MTISEPVLIVGGGRSGTTLLFNLLSQHPGLVRTTGYPDGEDHEGWIRHGRCAMAGIGNTEHSQYGSGINGWNACLHLTESDATPDIVAAMRQYYWRDVLREDGSRRVLTKQPHLSNKLRYVLGILPDARVIHIVRDCEPFVASWMAVMENHPSLVAYWPDEPYPCLWLLEKPEAGSPAARAVERHPRFFPGGGAGMWIDYWNAVNSYIAPQMQEHPAQLCVVRYEDLVADPARVLAAITEFCHLPAHVYDVAGIVPGTSGRHLRHLTPWLRSDIARRAAPVRRHFGYDAVDQTLAVPA